ncbi:MAG: hypothetical protein D8M28_11825 [Proteobacteria bacterium]|nr:hypothetical protein [Pseudomonadota bacterium]
MKKDAFYNAHEKIGHTIRETAFKRFRKHNMFEYTATTDRYDPLAQVLDAYLNHFEAAWVELWEMLDLGDYDPADAKTGKDESCKNAMGLAEYMRDSTTTAVLAYEAEEPGQEFFAMVLVARDAPMTPLTDEFQCVFENEDENDHIEDSVRAIANIAETVKHGICDILRSTAEDAYIAFHSKAGQEPTLPKQRKAGKPSLTVIS